MPNTYTQIYIHCVFAVKYRVGLIQPAWEERLHQYITGIVQNNGHKLIAINSASDHTHLLIGFNPKQSLSELMRLVKGDSAEFVNKQRLTMGRFQWQEGIRRVQQQPFAGKRRSRIHCRAKRTPS